MDAIAFGLFVLGIGMVVMMYHAATTPEYSGTPVQPVGTYAVQVQDYQLQQKVWCTVFTGSFSACSEVQSELFQQGHTSATARVVQLI